MNKSHKKDLTLSDGQMKQLSVFPAWLTHRTLALNVTRGQHFSWVKEQSDVNNLVLSHMMILGPVYVAKEADSALLGTRVTHQNS